MSKIEIIKLTGNWMLDARYWILDAGPESFREDAFSFLIHDNFKRLVEDFSVL